MSLMQIYLLSILITYLSCVPFLVRLFIFDYKIFGSKCVIGDIVGALIIFLLCLIPIGNIIIGVVYGSCGFYNKEKFRELVSKR